MNKLTTETLDSCDSAAKTAEFKRRGRPLYLRLPPRLFVPIEGYDMLQVDLGTFYKIGRGVGHLTRLKAGAITKAHWEILDEAADCLEALCRPTEPVVTLQTSRSSAIKLSEIVESMFQKAISGKNTEKQITEWEITKIRSALEKFEAVFTEETKTLSTYYVASKRNYSTSSLIEHSEREFPEAIIKRLSPQCVIDINAAGRCIAFEIGTASGIHSFRALEATAMDYLSKRNLTPAKRDLFTYFDMLQKDGADPKVIQIGQQLRDLRRNPLAHPTDNLNVDEAIEAFQLCTTAITALIRDMEKRGLFPN